jgi:lysozyme family protein
MTAFEAALAHTLGIEGNFSDDPADSGGATRYGITEAVARRHGYQGPMGQLPLSSAKLIYRTAYWDLLQLDVVAALSESIALELFDTAVNMGVTFASHSLRRCLNVFNREQADYSDISTEGLIDTPTVLALRAYLIKRGRAGILVLLRALNALQGAHYILLAERRAKDEKFVYGWFNQRVA